MQDLSKRLDGRTRRKVITRLQKAESLLETRGWTKGTMARDKRGDEVGLFTERRDGGYRRNGECTCFCVSGAVDYVCLDNVQRDVDQDLAYEIRRALDTQLQKRTQLSLIGWNDSPEVKKEDVLSLIREARKGLEAQALNARSR